MNNAGGAGWSVGDQSLVLPSFWKSELSIRLTEIDVLTKWQLHISLSHALAENFHSLKVSCMFIGFSPSDRCFDPYHSCVS
jgi:hypothetical protein